MLARKVRQLTQEIRNALGSKWRNQAELADLMQESQRTINSRIQSLWSFGELQKRTTVARGVEYRLRKKRLPLRRERYVTRRELVAAIRQVTGTGADFCDARLRNLAELLDRMVP